MKQGIRRRWGSFGLFVCAAIIAIVFLAPVFWMVVTSLKTDSAVGVFPPSVLPSPATLSNYAQVFSQYGFQMPIINSVIVSVVSTFLVLLLGSMAAYALARLPMAGKKGILILLLMISVFPEISLISPLYMLMHNLGWLNSYQGLILPYTAINLPFAIWILRNYFLAVPKEMEEICRVEGVSAVRTLFQIILPQVTPGLFVGGVFAFTACWAEFLMALTFNNSARFHTIPVALASFGTEFSQPYGSIFAASIITILPIAILVLVFRRSVVSGLTQGAVKG